DADGAGTRRNQVGLAAKQSVEEESDAASAWPDEGPGVGPRHPQPGEILDQEDEADHRRDPAGGRQSRPGPDIGRGQGAGEQQDARNDDEERPAVGAEIEPDDSLGAAEPTERAPCDPEE